MCQARCQAPVCPDGTRLRMVPATLDPVLRETHRPAHNFPNVTLPRVPPTEGLPGEATLNLHWKDQGHLSRMTG